MRKLTAKVVTGLMVVGLLTTGAGMAKANATVTTYTVQPGDSLWKVATRYNTTVNYLKQLNNHWSNYIIAGQTLKVPGQTAASKTTYTVRSGDTLWKIALRYGITYHEIMKMNNLTSDHIYVGQRLVLPGSTTPTTSVQRGYNYTQEELVQMARIIYAESRGEPYLGQVAVGAVLMNRLKSPAFPNTLRGVIYQDRAFESVANGEYSRVPNESAYRAAKAAFAGEDPTGGALYFFNPAKITNPKSWVWTRKIVLRIGNHVFAI